MASKTTAYANSAIRVFWLNDGNRTHTQSATNFRPTIRLRSTYKRCVLESNQCKRFCRPSPSHSDNSPYCSFSRTRTYTLTFVVLCDNPFHYETICTQWRNWTLSFGFGDQLAAIAYHAIEQMRGIEPPSPTWREGVMTIIRHLLKNKKPQLIKVRVSINYLNKLS